MSGSWNLKDESKQRINNCRMFLRFAWMALTTDSRIFAAVMINSFRVEGEATIKSITLKGHREGEKFNL